ncbi:MAG: putative endopeptidase precursor [Actinomycetia bacterium]|jgi:cell wall-associated NlpC family hydrolase|nr:putative endopeptidase precursor [Actinomycetes bacterium]
MTGTRTRIARLLVAVVFALPVLLSGLSIASLAAPSAEEVEAAKAKLAGLQHEFEVLAEQYNDAKYRLALIERRLAEAREQRDVAERLAQTAEGRLAKRAVQAYVGTGSQVDGLLGAETIAEFSDRLEFMGAVAEADAEIARTALNARKEADWAADRYTGVLSERQKQADRIADELAQIEEMIDQQESLARDLETDRETYLEALAAQRAALQQAQEEATQSVTPDPVPDFVPPPNVSAAGIAVQAAYSVVGTPYVFGSADPSIGLDCSGVTVYAWGQAGVGLPHSAQAQYSSFPRIPLSTVQPGDLVYYGNYGPHIAIYVGGGMIIHASSPAPGGQSRVDSMYGYDEPWGAVRVI